jgi:hypothetical protein
MLNQFFKLVQNLVNPKQSFPLLPPPKDSDDFPLKGKPHWRRIKEVLAILDRSHRKKTYNELIEEVRHTTGKGCSRKLISKWKKERKL